MQKKTALYFCLFAFILGGISVYATHKYWCNNHTDVRIQHSIPPPDTVYLPASHIDNLPVQKSEDHSGCWSSVFGIVGSDTLRIDSANSCLGIYKNISIAHAPYIHIESPAQNNTIVNVPVKATDNCEKNLKGASFISAINELIPAPVPSLGYELLGKAEINPSLQNLYLGLEFPMWFHRVGITIEPFFIVGKTSFSFLGLGVQYRILP